MTRRCVAAPKKESAERVRHWQTLPDINDKAVTMMSAGAEGALDKVLSVYRKKHLHQDILAAAVRNL